MKRLLLEHVTAISVLSGVFEFSFFAHYQATGEFEVSPEFDN